MKLRMICEFPYLQPSLSELPDSLYHGTASIHLDSIKRHGLLLEYLGSGIGPNDWQGQHDAIYFTADPKNAATYGSWMCDSLGGEPLVVEVPFDRLDQSKFVSDEGWEDNANDYYDELPDNFTWRDSLLMGGQVAYLDDIPPSLITGIHIWDRI